MEPFKSALFSVNWRDAFKAVLTSIFASVGLAAGIVVKRKASSSDYTFTMMDLKLVLSMSLLIFMMRLTERFMTDDKGKIFGRY